MDASFDQAKASLDIDYAPTLDICFKKLLSNRIDMIPTQAREANAAFIRLSLGSQDRPVIIRPELTENHNYFGFSRQKKLSGFKKEFDQKLKQMIENGEISALLKEKYGMSDDEIQ